MPARDIFICHAHVDKVSHVRPLVTELGRRGVSCWVDEGELLPGVSLIDAINDGLATAIYVLVLITEDFLQRNWTQRELNAALSREIRTGSVVVIPVLAVSHDSYVTRYPLLEDKIYLDWADGVDVVAGKLADLFSRRPATEWHADHPEPYVGMVWVRVLPQEANVGREHQLTLRWGPYIKHVSFTPRSPGPVSLLHHKTGADAITLHAQISPASIVTFGQGNPPDQPPINIDEGWTRTAGGSFPGHL